MEKSSENQKQQQAKQQSVAKQPYEPPKATFIPLKIEERLLGCVAKDNGICVDQAS